MNNYVIGSITTIDKGEVLDLLMEQHGDDLLKLVYSYTKNHAIAEELTQEVFIKSFEKFDTYKEQCTIKTWLWRIAINHCKDYLKSWNYRKVIISEKLSKEPYSTEQETVEWRLSKNLMMKYCQQQFYHYQ